MNSLVLCGKLKYMEKVFDKIRRRKTRLLAEQNFLINDGCDRDPRTTSEDRIVGDQNGLRGRSFVYGKYPASHNACEAIAVHNAKVLLGKPSKLSSTIAEFQNLHAMIFSGFFGSNVFRIGRVLKKEGIPFKRIFRKRRLKFPGLYIVSFWNEKPLKNGIHTVAVRYDNVKYETYNLWGNGRVSEESPLSYGKRFIIGYRLGDGGIGGTDEKKSV